MGRILKLAGIVIGAVFALCVAVLVAVALLVDPNDYKGDITDAVSRSTGRDLQLDGDLRLQVFPSLRIELGGAELSNAPGFGDAPFAAVDSAQLRLGLLPLLFGRIEVAEARLFGFKLNLARDAAGASNWDELLSALEEDEAPEADAEAEIADERSEFKIDIAAVQIAGAEVSWSDAASDTHWRLSNFDFDASGFAPGRAFPIDCSFDLAGDGLELAVEAGMRATLALEDEAYRLDDVRIGVAGEGAAWPGSGGRVDLDIESLAADLQAETIQVEDLVLEAFGISIAGSLSGRQLLSDLSLTGAVDVAPFDPHGLLDAFAVAIETADPDVFRSASARAELFYDASQISLTDMTLQLDDSELVGSMGLHGEAMRFDFDIDEINIDRYLPPAAGGDEAAADEGSLDEVDLPLDVLRTSTASGELRFGKAQFDGLSLTDVRFVLNVTPGRLRLTPTASLYGGSLDGEIGIDVRGSSARLSVVQHIRDIDLTAFGRDYLDSERISGTGNINLDVAADGSNVGELERRLNGDVSFRFSDGAWEGMDVWYGIRSARALANQTPAPPREAGPARTTFSDISASGVVENSVLINRDLSATLPFMTLAGSGSVNLLSQAMDIKLTARIADTEFVTADPLVADFAGRSLPLAIGGTLDAPSIRPDFSAIIRERVREEVRERVTDRIQERVREQAEEEIRDEAEQAVEEEVRDRVRDRLRGLFD